MLALGSDAFRLVKLNMSLLGDSLEGLDAPAAPRLLDAAEDCCEIVSAVAYASSDGTLYEVQLLWPGHLRSRQLFSDQSQRISTVPYDWITGILFGPSGLALYEYAILSTPNQYGISASYQKVLPREGGPKVNAYDQPVRGRNWSHRAGVIGLKVDEEDWPRQLLY